MPGSALRRGATFAASGLAALAAAGGLAGCGSTHHTTTSAGSATSAATTAPATTTAPAAPTACQARGLRMSLADSGDGAAATRYLTIRATNTGASPCTIGGYFGVSAYSLTGAAIEKHNAHAPGSPLRNVTVPPGGAVTFTAGINDLAAGPQGQCPRLGSFHLVPPGDTTAVTLPLASAGVVECAGVITVRAVRSA